MKNYKTTFTALEKAHLAREINSLSGFTLIEIILISMVVMTLALITLPNFSKSKKVALKKEAISYVKLITAAERIYRIENDTYVACSGAACNNLLSLMLNTANWDYNVTSATAGTVNIKADNNSILPGCSYTTDQDSLDSGPVAAGCP